MAMTSLGGWSVPVAILAGTLRVSAPFLFVSVGECLTEKSGKINLGLEGTVLMGAMSAYAVSYLSQDWAGSAIAPWLGVLAAGLVGIGLGSIHAAIVLRRRINDVAVGIAMIFFGSGLAFFLGKPFIQPQAPQIPPLTWGQWSALPQWQEALNLSPLLLVGVVIPFALQWVFTQTYWGLCIRAVGDNPQAARALGISVRGVRWLCIAIGSGLAGIGGAYLSLVYPGSWSEGVSSGQGLMAVALVIFARWQPLNCLWASLFFGGAQAISPALQAVGFREGYYLFNAAPYVLTLLIMLVTCSPRRRLVGAPGALGQMD